MHSAIAVACLLVAGINVQVPAFDSRVGTKDPGQDRNQQWARLQQAQGLTVSVEETSGNKISGVLLRLEDETLVLRVDETEQRIARDLIRRVTSKRKDSVKNGILTGALVGAGMAAMSSCHIGDRKCGAAGRVGFVAFGAALWALIGGAIDGSIDKRITLYEARAK